MTTLTDHDEQGTGPDDGQAPAPAGRSLRRRAAAGRTGGPLRSRPGRRAPPPQPDVAARRVLLVVLSALGGVLLFSSNDDRTEVLVAADDLEPGEPIERSDLRIERVAIDGGSPRSTRRTPPSCRPDPGRAGPGGRVLAPGMFADEVALGADEMVVGAALDPGEAPLSGLQVGAPVELLGVDAGRCTCNERRRRTGSGRRTVAVSLGHRHGVGRRAGRHRPAVGRRCASTATSASPRRRPSAADTLRVVLVGAAG